MSTWTYMIGAAVLLWSASFVVCLYGYVDACLEGWRAERDAHSLTWARLQDARRELEETQRAVNHYRERLAEYLSRGTDARMFDMTVGAVARTFMGRHEVEVFLQSVSYTYRVPAGLLYLARGNPDLLEREMKRVVRDVSEHLGKQAADAILKEVEKLG